MTKTKSPAKAITWSLRTVKVADLIDLESNPRTITPEELKKIKMSVEKFGLIDKPCVNTDMRLIGGHRRTEIYRAYGVEDIQVWWPSRTLTDEEVRELNIRLNRNTGSWDWEKLGDLFDPNELLDWGFDTSEIGWSGEEPHLPAPAEYTEEIANKVEYLECPNCHHKWPK